MGANIKYFQDTVTVNAVDTSIVKINEQIGVTTPDTVDEVIVTNKPETITMDTIKKSPAKIETTQHRFIPKDKVVENQEINDVTEHQNFLKYLTSKNYDTKPEKVFIEKGRGENNFIKGKIDGEKLLVTNDWILPFVMASIGIMIWVRKAYIRQIGLLFNSINSYQLSLKLFKDPSTRFQIFSFVLNINAALTVGLFLYQLINFYSGNLNNGNQIIIYLSIVAFLVIIYILQLIVYSVLGYILNSQKEYNEFLYHTYSMIKISGIIMIPIIIINAYATDFVLPLFLILGVITLVFFYLKRLQRGILILMQKQFLKFHQILYFCTLEILPILVISKFVRSLIERSF